MMIAIVTMLTLSLLLTINTANYLHTHQLQPSNELAYDYQHDHPALPRKLMVNNKDEDHNAKELVSFNRQNKAFAVKPHKGEEEEEAAAAAAAKVTIHAVKGTRQEWIEESDSNHEFFTMDYSHVKRRRPIHNKSFPNTVTNSP